MRKLTRMIPVVAVGAIVAFAAFVGPFERSLPWLRAHLSVADGDPTVVQKIRALSRLETVSFTEQKVLEGKKEWPAMPQWLLGDKLLFVAQGEVTAGVDLSKFGPEHLVWNGEQVHVKLPRPEVFHVGLDDRASHVYDRSTGWMNKSDPQLETRVRQRADDALLSSALEEGILDQARRNAEKEVGRLLRSCGAKTVTFV